MQGWGGGDCHSSVPTGVGTQNLPFSNKIHPGAGHWEPLALFPWIRLVPGTSTITFGSKPSVPDVGIYLGTLQANVKSPLSITSMFLGLKNPENPAGLGPCGAASLGAGIGNRFHCTMAHKENRFAVPGGPREAKLYSNRW